MKIGSLALVSVVGCAVWAAACASDSKPSGGPEAGAGGRSDFGDTGTAGSGAKSTGGAATGGTSAGGAATGGKAGSGGSNVADSGTPIDASMTVPDAAADSGAHDGGDGAANCLDSRCVPRYPKVQYPELNQPSDDKAMLGKFLFWDEQMGELDSMTCGSCHRSFSGGSDPRTKDRNSMGVEIAHLPGPDGILDANPGLTSDDIRGAAGVLECASPSAVTGTAPQVTTRKPPSYFDAMFAPRVFWDGRAGDCKTGDGPAGGCFYDPDALAVNKNAKPLIVGTTDVVTGRVVGAALEAQSVGPPTNPKEMACADQDWTKIEAKLKTVSPLAKAKAGSIPRDMTEFAGNYNTYPKMFAQAFGSSAKVNANDPDDVINSQRIAFAIATHERRLTSDQTPWDRWIEGDDAAMTAQQIRGYVAFMGPGRCQFCHPPPLFSDEAFHFIGFHKPDWDKGRGAITGSDSDLAKFKTPTLRNVGLREPYGLLHEGEGPGHDLTTIMQLYKQGGFRTDPAILPLIDPGLLELTNLTASEVTDMIEFLRNGLTDPRVKDEKPPFDRPHLSTE